MPKHKFYTAKNDMRMDCGHTVKAGETFHVNSVFTCDHEGSWPMRVLMACFSPRAKVQPEQPNKDEQGTPEPAKQPEAKA